MAQGPGAHCGAAQAWVPAPQDLSQGPPSLLLVFLSFYEGLCSHRASLVAQMVNNPPAMGETWVQSLGWEDLLEEGMATHSSILAWRIPWTEEPGRLQPMGLQRVGHD